MKWRAPRDSAHRIGLGSARQGYGGGLGRGGARLCGGSTVGLRAWDSTKGGRINYVTSLVSNHGIHRRFILALIGGNSPRTDRLIM